MQGVVAPASVCVVSPHLDDAVLSCGRFLASHPGCTVLTVFAAAPPSHTVVTGYDARCGFSSSSQAMAVRLVEDDCALALLNSTPQRMSELDSQYADLPEPVELARRLWGVLGDRHLDAILVPLGLFHCDHECVSDACLQLLRQHPETMWIGFEDVLYRRRAGVLQRRLATLLHAGVCATPITLQGASACESARGANPTATTVTTTTLSAGTSAAHCAIDACPTARCAVPAHSPDAAARKAAAVASYASKLPCLGIAHCGDDGTEEGYWLLAIDVNSDAHTETSAHTSANDARTV